MTETDELANLRAQLTRLQQRQTQAAGDADRRERLLVARVLVVVVTIALFLALSMGWYADVEVDDEDFELLSGWQVFSALGGSDEGVLVFGGVYSWVVALAALAAGAAVLELRARWLAITLSTLLTPLALGQLLVNLATDDGEQLAGVWCGIVVLFAAAFAWGNLVGALRDLANAEP